MPFFTDETGATPTDYIITALVLGIGIAVVNYLY